MSNDVAGAGVEGPVPHCYRHPNRETLIRCTRCDRPICPDCMRPASVGFQCPDDVKEARKTVRQPRNAVGAQASGGRLTVVVPSPTPVTSVLIAINVVVYLLTATASGSGGLNNPGGRLFSDWLLVPALVAHGHEYDRLITAAFIHLSFWHILLNMWALYVIGPFLERFMGWWRYLAVYLVGALGGSVAIYLFANQYVPEAGASGAIFGLFAAALFFVHDLRLDRNWLIVIIAVNFIYTFSAANISKWGHVGGFVLGAVAAAAIGGLPWRRRRLTSGAQAFGLAGILLVLIVLVVFRTNQLG